MEQKPDAPKPAPAPMRKQRPEGYSPIMHRVDFSPDATPHEIAEALCRYADDTGRPVVMNYHGTDIQALPGESVGQVAARLEQPVGIIPDHPVIGRQVRTPDRMVLQPREVQRDAQRALQPERLPRAGTHPLQPGEQVEYEAGKIHTGTEDVLGQPGYTMGPSIQNPGEGIAPTPDERVEAAEIKKEPPATPPAAQPAPGTPAPQPEKPK